MRHAEPTSCLCSASNDRRVATEAQGAGFFPPPPHTDGAQGSSTPTYFVAACPPAPRPALPGLSLQLHRRRRSTPAGRNVPGQRRLAAADRAFTHQALLPTGRTLFAARTFTPIAIACTGTRKGGTPAVLEVISAAYVAFTDPAPPWQLLLFVAC